MSPKFSLQSVLDFHHNRVERLEMELGLLNRQKSEIEEALSQMRNQESQMIDELIVFQDGEMDMKMITHIRANIDHLRKKIDQKIQAKRAVEEAILLKQQEIIAAKQDEAVFEKLREKEMAEWTEKADKKEKETLSDIYISQAHRQNAFNGSNGGRFR